MYFVHSIVTVITEYSFKTNQKLLNTVELANFVTGRG